MTAIIPAAGHGTRFAPYTRLVPKELLPIGTRPALSLLVEEAREAGADEIIIITSPEKPLLKRWFAIEQPLTKITWVDQLEQHGLGHAILQAAPCVRDENILILLGDALVFGCSASQEMAALSGQRGGAAVIGCEHVPAECVSRYGILSLDGDRVTGLVEKPAANEAPSDLAIAGRYLLPARIFDFLASQKPGKGGEIQLTDAIMRMISDSNPVTLLAYVYPGHRYDIGNPNGYFKALEAWHANH